jgi:hypothetical protein
MGIFSLNWFKSRKKEELEELQIEEQRIKNELLRKQLYVNEGTKIPENITIKLDGPVVPEKPYKSVKLVNDVLTVVFNDGSVVSKPNATNDDFNDVRVARTESEIVNLISTPEVAYDRRKNEAEIARMNALKKGIDTLRGLPDFEIEGNSVKLSGTGRTMPQLLVEKFIQIVEMYNMDPFNDVTQDEEYQALKRFFMWCCLNPRAEVANDLYEFLEKNSFRITKQGFFVALRNVVTLHGSTELVQFVSNAYNKVKAVWKKSPDNYDVYLKDGNYAFIHVDETYITEMEECDCYDEEEWDGCDDCNNGEREITIKNPHLGERIGNLTELYLDLPNRAENRFTDAHTRTFDIRVGRVVNMPPEECNWNRADCAHAGLHFTADEIHYVGCGDQSVLVLINPMKIVGIGQSKGRCYEYLPIMTVSRDEATEILHDLDFDTLELDEDYAIRELEDLAIKAKVGFVVEASKHQFNIPAMTHINIDNIVESLEEMKNNISKRVVNLD